MKFNDREVISKRGGDSFDRFVVICVSSRLIFSAICLQISIIYHPIYYVTGNNVLYISVFFFFFFLGIISYTEYLFLLSILISKYLPSDLFIYF